MQTWIALFRGINVGGHRKIPMKDLKSLFASNGFHNVQSYIQSGNVVFEADSKTARDVREEVEGLIEEAFGFSVDVLILPVVAFRQALAACPFEVEADDEKTVHLFFFTNAAPDAPDVAGLEKVKAASETFELSEVGLFLHAPDGIGRSKLVERVDRLLGVQTTARNLKTLKAIEALAQKAI